VGRPDAETIRIARESCAAVADRPAAIAETFYVHLFELAPAVRDMFPADMSIQNERMSRTLLDAVRNADDPEKVERLLQRMGAAHARNHAVIAEHYPYVGRALVRAVRELSPRWSAVVGSAWVQVYEWMAAHMVLGADVEAAQGPDRPQQSTAGFRGAFGGAYGEGLPASAWREPVRAAAPRH
jgi:hemoglobin-like flavoprotein